MSVLVSVIIPTYNRYDQLQRTLTHLALLPDDPALYEILVVDNGSTDSTEATVKAFMENHPALNAAYFYDPIPGLLTGRHRGAKEAKGDIFTFIDDDVHVSDQWLGAIIATMRNKPEVMLLTGPALPLYETAPPEWLESLWTQHPDGRHCGWHSLLDFGENEKKIRPDFVWGLNFTIRKSAFDELQGFHPDNIPPRLQSFQGDGETGLTRKAFEKDMVAWYDPKAKLFHEIPQERLTIDYFRKRAFYQGICNSFTQIREDKGLYKTSNTKEKSQKVRPTRWLKSTLKKAISVLGKPQAPVAMTGDLLSELNLEEKKGFDFHQSCFETQTEVRDWVLKENYLDYKLPIL